MRSTFKIMCSAIILSLQLKLTMGFLSPEIGGRRSVNRNTDFNIQPNPSAIVSPQRRDPANKIQQSPAFVTFQANSKTSLPMVWWYGGSQTTDERTDDESCELVAVRIERTSANSRRIFGEITAEAVGSEEVWSILTDYDNLSTHVPNLVESKIVQRLSGGKPGDGQYQCRLYQKGAQKIIGFEFGASVTMDMKESVLESVDGSKTIRKINFKCYDSFFFQEFDGEWKVYDRINPSTGTIESIVSYTVDVRPKGPVPVAALEWRIREDVPTNLRAVKKAATTISVAKSLRNNNNNLQLLQPAPTRNGVNNPTGAARKAILTLRNSARKASASLAKDTRMKVSWYEDETMAAYLSDNS